MILEKNDSYSFFDDENEQENETTAISGSKSKQAFILTDDSCKIFEITEDLT